jgi:large subunit ribosomal protein L14e
MPTLQGLPQELLEMVFLYSMNTSLPRASHELGRRLSSKAIIMEFCMRTFFYTVDHKADLRDQKVTSDPVVQSDLLSCQFFTWPFFLAYVERARDALVKLRGRLWANASVTVPDAFYFDGLWPLKFTKIKYLGLAEGFKIPEKLLHGPWTSDKTSLLYVLVSMNGEIDWEGSMAGETAKDGLMSAIEEGNERAVAALSVLLGVVRAISTDMLRHAVVDCGCNFNILRHLLFNAQILYHGSSKGLLELHDPSLWQWADEDGLEDGKGEMLKDMLKRAEKFDLEFYREGESDWMSIAPFPYSGEKFDARAALDDITRELLTRLYRNYGRRMTITRRGRHAEGHAAVMAETEMEGADREDAEAELI